MTQIEKEVKVLLKRYPVEMLLGYISKVHHDYAETKEAKNAAHSEFAKIGGQSEMWHAVADAIDAANQKIGDIVPRVSYDDSHKVKVPIKVKCYYCKGVIKDGQTPSSLWGGKRIVHRHGSDCDVFGLQKNGLGVSMTGGRK